jgi:hypothetical protein
VPGCAAAFGILGDDSIAPDARAPTATAASSNADVRKAGLNVPAVLLRALPAIAESAGASSPPDSSLKASAFIVSDSGVRKWTYLDRPWLPEKVSRESCQLSVLSGQAKR